jgi:cell division protein FtsB
LFISLFQVLSVVIASLYQGLIKCNQVAQEQEQESCQLKQSKRTSVFSVNVGFATYSGK